jgi:hypothetical protein
MKLFFSIWEKTLRFDSPIVILHKKKIATICMTYEMDMFFCLMGNQNSGGGSNNIQCGSLVAYDLYQIWLDGELLLIAKISQLWTSHPLCVVFSKRRFPMLTLSKLDFEYLTGVTTHTNVHKFQYWGYRRAVKWDGTWRCYLAVRYSYSEVLPSLKLKSLLCNAEHIIITT